MKTTVDGQSSTRAIADLTALCQDRLTGRHRIEIVDVFGHPDRVIRTLQATDDVVAALRLAGANA